MSIEIKQSVEETFFLFFKGPWNGNVILGGIILAHIVAEDGAHIGIFGWIWVKSETGLSRIYEVAMSQKPILSELSGYRYL